MPVIVFSKRTGKYLQRHSGSFNRKVSDMRWKLGKKIGEKFGPAPAWHQGMSEKAQDEYKRYHADVRQFCEDSIFNAEPGDARVYASEGSAKTSVGTWDKPFKDHVYKLPEHMEIHEIKESFVCVMRPDDSSNCDEEEDNEQGRS